MRELYSIMGDTSLIAAILRIEASSIPLIPFLVCVMYERVVAGTGLTLNTSCMRFKNVAGLRKKVVEEYTKKLDTGDGHDAVDKLVEELKAEASLWVQKCVDDAQKLIAGEFDLHTVEDDDDKSKHSGKGNDRDRDEFNHGYLDTPPKNHGDRDTPPKRSFHAEGGAASLSRLVRLYVVIIVDV